MKKYKCVSRKLPTGPCEHNCRVECEFEPGSCLKYAIYERWEEEKEKIENIEDSIISVTKEMLL